jgi:hypothetical protein
MLICALLMPLCSFAQAQSDNGAVQVEVVANASEYIPRSMTFSHPGHSYTDCSGSTSFFGQFNTYGNSVSGTAYTSTSCSTTSYPPTESTFTVYRKVNWTIVRSDQALYLLSCTQKWRWSKCPSLRIGANYRLTIEKSHVFLADTTEGKPIKLDYISSVAVPLPGKQSAAPPQTQVVSSLEGVKVHITSSPSGGEIYVDGKFFGNTPSDITIAVGEHLVKVTMGGKEWSRSVQITAGEVTLHAEMTAEK